MFDLLHQQLKQEDYSPIIKQVSMAYPHQPKHHNENSSFLSLEISHSSSRETWLPYQKLIMGDANSCDLYGYLKEICI